MDRRLRVAKRGAARLREADERILSAAKHEREKADTRVKDVEEYIWLITTRTRAIELLKAHHDLPDVSAFLSEIEGHK